MAHTPQEKKARAAYREKVLAAKPGLSPSSLRSYVGAVGSGGALSLAAREVSGLLPEDSPSLLLLTDPDQIRKAADWWSQVSTAFPGSQQSAMNLWLSLSADLSHDYAYTGVRDLPLQAPPHGVRLRHLLQAFFPERKKSAPFPLYESLLHILISPFRLSLEEGHLRESSPLFRDLRLQILQRLDDCPEETAAALSARWPRGQLARRCKGLVGHCMSTYGPALLSDAAARPVAGQDSFLFALDRLSCAPPDRCAHEFLNVVQLLLLDCSPAQRPVCLPPEQAPRFWDCPLLPRLMEQEPPSPELLEFCLDHIPLPVLTARQELALPLFHGTLHFSQTPHARAGAAQWEQAAHWAGRAERELARLWPALEEGLPLSHPHWSSPISPSRVWEGPKSCLLRADLLLAHARLLLLRPEGPIPPLRRGHELMEVQESLRRCEKLLMAALDDRRSAALDPEDESLPAKLVQLYLLQGELQRQLALLETQEVCLGDAVLMYLRPARISLAMALDAAQQAPFHERGALMSRWDTVCRHCTDTFFSPRSPLVTRLGLRGEEDRSLYQQERELWDEELPLPSALPPFPRRLPPLDPRELHNALRFEPVYSGIFDSVTGRSEGSRQAIELTLFQLLASGKTCLLQMNQIVDNRTMLQLLTTPGFRQACRSGLISLSCFSELTGPRDYLLNCLKSPTFSFSSSSIYGDDGLRALMLDYLDPLSPVSLADFPAHLREEAEFLTDAYRMLFECFQPSDLLRFHQNKALRYPPCPSFSSRAQIRTLPQVLEQRLEQLIQQAVLTGRDTTMLAQLEEYRKRWVRFTARSDYDSAIRGALDQAGPEEAAALEKFRSLVCDCYFLSNGGRSSRTILLTQRDPELTLSTDLSGMDAAKQNTLQRIFHQKCRPADQGVFSWPDVCQQATQVREIDLRDSALSARQRARIKAAAMGCSYVSYGRSTFASAITATTSQHDTLALSPAEDHATEHSLEFHNVR